MKPYKKPTRENINKITNEYIESIKALLPGSSDDEFWEERLEAIKELYIVYNLLDKRK